jgi:succinate dehydrogenase/fumarate reductase flavoprotein subunit
MERRPAIPEKWNREADIVVVGYGAAGAATAITAHDAGARVLILEKAPEGEEGGNSRVSLQVWLTPTPVDKAITYFNALCGAYAVPAEMVQAWAEEMGKNNDWILGLGGNMATAISGRERAEFPELPGADCVHAYYLQPELGCEHLWKLLKGAVDKRRLEVLHATPGKELIQNYPTREILGVRAEREGKAFQVKAKRAVVLTCGGFENNQQMLRDFLPNMPYCYPLGTPYNTGDGIKMSLAVGADLWHMNNIAGPFYHLKVPDFPAVLEVSQLYSRERPGGMIIIGGDGKRFTNERARNTHGKVKVSGQWVQSPTPCPMFLIFDHVIFSAGPLYDNNLNHGWNQRLKLYHWSNDNSAEVAKGWIKKADTIAKLARKVGLDSTVVEETVNRWNAHCAAGKDAEFGRTRMLLPITAAPFYAIELSPTLLNTQGGPRRNERGQILQPDGSPIPRLYSAGELGSIHSFLYQGAGNLGECLAFGRISGRNAAAERPWE